MMQPTKLIWGKKTLIATFDFSTRYTKINSKTSHKKLKFALGELINFHFKVGSENHIAVTKLGPRWVDDEKYYKVLFDKPNLKLL